MLENTLTIGKINEGFVLDHIEAGKSMEIYKHLKLDKLDCCVAIIKNAKSSVQTAAAITHTVSSRFWPKSHMQNNAASAALSIDDIIAKAFFMRTYRPKAAEKRSSASFYHYL